MGTRVLVIGKLLSMIGASLLIYPYLDVNAWARIVTFVRFGV